MIDMMCGRYYSGGAFPQLFENKFYQLRYLEAMVQTSDMWKSPGQGSFGKVSIKYGTPSKFSCGGVSLFTE